MGNAISDRIKNRITGELRARIDFILVWVSEFAERYGLSMQDAYFYLRQYKGIEFLQEFYDVEHTLPFDDVVDDLTTICRHNGGTVE